MIEIESEKTIHCVSIDTLRLSSNSEANARLYQNIFKKLIFNTICVVMYTADLNQTTPQCVIRCLFQLFLKSFTAICFRYITNRKYICKIFQTFGSIRFRIHRNGVDDLLIYSPSPIYVNKSSNAIISHDIYIQLHFLQYSFIS